MSPLLEIENLSVRLPVEGEMRTVLHDVSLRLEAGRTLGLVGESGSGKSMTARAVARLLPPGAESSGRVEFAGTSVLDLRGPALRAYRAGDVAMVFQDPRAHVNPVYRIGHFLTEALRMDRRTGRRAAERTAVDLLAEVGVTDPGRRMRQYPHELSGGLLQRVMIAAAVAVRPRLILADEPTTALDMTTQADVMRILDGLRREYGMAMLLITHDLELAGAVCDEIAVMYAGGIVERQGSERLSQDPLHPYTAALLRARPDIARRVERLPAVPGRPTSAYEAPEGCAFAPRCAHVRPECREALPPLRAVDGAHSRCLRVDGLRGALLHTEGTTAP
ncbi:ABC transporter ATP-binding protein [Nocardiopsis protaetiae]|uniref:ABC transporter ATP-binding protein n=1 Tax=Nocardiopsis protaetiae TaxID=3382270 RepID=UPI00387AC171